MTEREIAHFTGKRWESIRTPLEWKNYIDEAAEQGIVLTPLENELYHDYVAMTDLAHANPRVALMNELEKRLAVLEHERGVLREAIAGNIRELDALATRNRDYLLLPVPPRANNEDDRCDSDPAKK